MPGKRKDIYEQRSMEVQSVLNRPPGKIIIWGNLVLVTVIGLALYLSNMIKIQKKYSGNYSIENIPVKPGSIIIIATDLPPEIFVGKKYPLKVGLYTIQSAKEAITCDIDSFKAVKGKIHLYGRSNRPIGESFGQINIGTDSETLLTNIYHGIIKNRLKKPI